MTILSIAHIVVETKTGLSIGSGLSRGQRDAEVVKDAWGLPTLPGSSLAGVLRQVYSVTRPEAANPVEAVFGFAGHREDDGVRSPVDLSFGVLHGSDDKPLVDVFLRRSRGDEIAAWFLDDFDRNAPIRHRERIDSRGVADAAGHGKFDRDVVPRGARFTFELAYRHDGGERAAATWSALLAAPSHPLFRLGAGSRSGLGGLRVVRIGSAQFDLADQSGLAAWSAAHSRLARLDASPLKATDVAAAAASGAGEAFDLTLYPRDFWRIGQSEAPLAAPGDVADPDRENRSGDEADVSPYIEPVVKWHAGSGSISEVNLLAPGSSIKGALRHRTAFHYDRLVGGFVSHKAAGQAAATAQTIDLHPAVVDLFGSLGDRGEDRNIDQTRGRVLIDDVLIPLDRENVGGLQTVMHNSVDRFSGGVRNKILFSERMAFRGKFTLAVRVLPGASAVSKTADRAFALALEDLKQGRLPIGAATGRGYGRLAEVRP